MIFYVGLHHPWDSIHFSHTFISVNSVRDRKSDFPANSFILDSGAFTEIFTHGRYRHEPEQYAEQVTRWSRNDGFQMAVTQDYMCEPFILNKTGMTIRQHQEMTIERFERISKATPANIMPVLQGYDMQDYLNHLEMYQERGLLNVGMRLGVGSVCKRNSDVSKVEDLILGIKECARGLKLHGFGLKTTALKSQWVWDSLYSADSMAWSFAARKEGRNSNAWTEAKRFEEQIRDQDRSRKSLQMTFFGLS